MILQNYHTHTLFCDGKQAPEEYLKRASEHGFYALGYSAHAEVPFENEWSIKPNKTNDYVEAINNLKTNSYGIEVFLGLEADYIPGLTTDFEIIRKKNNLDYIIGSIHLVRKANSDDLWFIDGPAEGYDKGLYELFDGNIKEGVKAFFDQTNEMISTQKFEIIGHLDKIKMNNKNRFFNEFELWFRNLINETLVLIKEKGIIVELNTRGLYKGRSKTFFPDVWTIEQCRKMKIPIIVNSDAHHADDLIGFFSEAEAALKEIGIKEIMKYNKNTWIPVNF
ncbi:MAG: histidinol-phosphatase [Bacteroidota bacterium]